LRTNANYKAILKEVSEETGVDFSMVQKVVQCFLAKTVVFIHGLVSLKNKANLVSTPFGHFYGKDLAEKDFGSCNQTEQHRVVRFRESKNHE
jgi:hypothetical protein